MISQNDKINLYQKKDSPFSSHSKIEKLLFRIQGKKKILDLACGKGCLSSPLNPNIEIIGIDKYKDAKPEYYSQFIKANIEDFSGIKKLKLGEFDFIILADALEHLVNPEEVLIFFSQLLKKKGKIIISVPNIANWFIRISLMFGQFNYSDKGILDRSHLRFFTLGSLSQLIRRTGFEIKKIIVTPIPFELVIPGLLSFKKMNLFLALSNKITKIFPTLLAYQFIFVVGKKI